MARIWIATDGMVTTKRIEVQDSPDVAHEQWCDVVRDALVERKWEAVYRMLEKHGEDELTGGPESDDYVLCVANVPTEQDAHDIIVRFCKLGYGSHPLLAPKERWYYLPGFCGTVDGLFGVSQMFQRFHESKVRNLKKRKRG